MIGSGLPLAEALRILSNQSKALMKGVVDKILAEVEGGSSLADAIERVVWRIFGCLCSDGKGGRVSCVLDSVMGKLVETMEKQRYFDQKPKEPWFIL